MNCYVILFLLLFLFQDVFAKRISVHSLPNKGKALRRCHENEDRFDIKLFPDQRLDCFAIFDGHGQKITEGGCSGEVVSSYLKKYFLNHVYESFAQGKFGDLTKSLQLATESIDKALCNLKQKPLFVGSTATSVSLFNDKAYFYNIGDSRSILLGKDGRVLFSTQDQKNTVESDRTKEIVKKGARLIRKIYVQDGYFFDSYLEDFYLSPDYSSFLSNIYTYPNLLELTDTNRIDALHSNEKFKQLWSDATLSDIYYLQFDFINEFTTKTFNLAMNSSFGDFVFRKVGLEPMPDINIYNLQGDEKYLVLASDGFWDVFENEDVFQLINEMLVKCENDFDKLATLLCKDAETLSLDKFGSSDDITVIVIDFEDNDSEN